MDVWTRRDRFSKALIIAGLVLVGIIVVAGCDGNSNTSTTTTTQQEAASSSTSTTASPTTASSTTETTATAAPTTTLPGATATTSTGRWVELATLSGSSDKTGDVFNLTGAPAELSFDITQGDTAIYLMEEGRSLEMNGGFPEITSMYAVKSSTRLLLEPGAYYLIVTAFTPYTVTVSEQR